MSIDIRTVKDMNGLIAYLAEKLEWKIDLDDFEDIEDITYDFDAKDIGLKEEAFAKITSLRQLPPLVDGQKWGIFCVEFDSKRFEITALRKILSGLIPKRRNSAEHAVWKQKDLLFICFWGNDNERTIGLAHFEDADAGLPQIKMISCCPAVEDFTQIGVFENRLKNLKWPANYLDHERWQSDWSSAFVTRYRQTIKDSSTLTVQLAAEAQEIKKRILAILDIETSNGYVHLLYEKFKNTLIHDMTESQFADMYAQTVVYGLFSARCMDKTQDDFSAAEAIELIPNTNPFLKSLMKECLGSQNNSKLSFDELEIGNVVELLLHTKTDAIIQDFNRQTGGGREDPVIHFYEEFLTAYDKSQKVQRGVYYTPQPVVKFIVNAVDYIIKNEFGYEDGLASTDNKTIKYIRDSKRTVNGTRTKVEDTKEVPAIQILDPATGTGTFLRETILRIYENFKNKNRNLSPEELKRKWNAYVPEHLLPRINGFELMMAPYAVAHMKLAMVLKDTGYDFNYDERLRVYLTNTLEEPGNSDGQLALWDDPLASESIAANAVKKNKGINILMGNPPYSGESSNKSEWIMKLMEDYKKEPGGIIKLQEKNSKWLNDDYVKFIRLGQMYIDQAETGILAYICPHGFLDNPTFRGMRWSLLQSYNSIYVINLHGNTKRKERTPNGNKDENVFDIMQGVCIIIGTKNKESKVGIAKVYYTDCFGFRDEKYDFLQKKSFYDINFDQLDLREPQYYFVNKDFSLKSEYDKGFSITDLFRLSSAGIVTSRDPLVLHESLAKAYEVTNDFMNLDENIARNKYNLGKDVQDWKVQWAQNDLRNSCQNGKIRKELFCKIAYRILDHKYGYYTGKSRGFMCRPRSDVMNHLVNHENLALVTVNRQPEQMPVGYYFIADTPVSNGFIRSDSVSIDTIFPLYIFSNEYGDEKRTVNFAQELVKKIEDSLKLEFTESDDYDKSHNFNSEDLLSYVYSILYSRSYRKKYSEYLKIDFPRIPYPSDKILFWKLVSLGHNLINIHLMRDKDKINSNNICFIEQGNRVVETTVSAAFKNERIYINKNSYFENVSEDLWTQYIGGYMPLQKWLKDRKGKKLSNFDIEHYTMMISVIKNTHEIMLQIDNVIKF